MRRFLVLLAPLALILGLLAPAVPAATPGQFLTVLNGNNACAGVEISVSFATGWGANCLNGVRFAGYSQIPGWSYSGGCANCTAVTLGGVVVAFANNTPRVTDQGLLTEAAATNLALWSSDMTNAAWSKTTTTTAQTATGPDLATNDATTLTASAGNATTLQVVSGASVARVYCEWIKRRTGSGNIQMTMDGGTGWSTQTITASWGRYCIVQTNLNPSIGLRIVTNADAVDVADGQLEAGGYGSSYIPTTTTSASRSADAVVITGLTTPANGWTLYARGTVFDGSGFPANVEVDDNSTANYAYIGQWDNNFAGVTFVNNGASAGQVVARVNVGVINTVTRMAYSVTGTTGRIAAAGSAAAAGNPLGAITFNRMRFGTDLVFGSYTGGYTSNIALFARPFSDSQLTAITTGN